MVRDVFTRGEITRQALALQILCVTERLGYLGGKIGVGRWVFEVYLMDGLLGHAMDGVGIDKRRIKGVESYGELASREA